MLGYGPQCKWITLDADLSGWVVPVVSSVARVEVERGRILVGNPQNVDGEGRGVGFMTAI